MTNTEPARYSFCSHEACRSSEGGGKKKKRKLYRGLGAMEVVTSVIKRNKAEEAQVGMEGMLLFCVSC